MYFNYDHQANTLNQYVPVAVLEELADSVVVVEGVVDAAEVVLTDELAVAVRGGDLFVEQVSVAHAGELAGRRVLSASLLTCGESIDIVQGDHSACAKPPADIDVKVAF